MTGRAVFSGARPNERLHERSAMRFGCRIRDKVDHVFDKRIPRTRPLVERWIGNGEPRIAYTPANVNDRMAGHAAQTRLSFGRVDLLFHWSIEFAVEEHGMVMAARAPLARFRTFHILHVLDRLPIKLVVERSKVMR